MKIYTQRLCRQRQLIRYAKMGKIDQIPFYISCLNSIGWLTNSTHTYTQCLGGYRENVSWKISLGCWRYHSQTLYNTLYGQRYSVVGELREWISIYLVLVRRLFHPHIESNCFSSFIHLLAFFLLFFISARCLVAAMLNTGLQRFSLQYWKNSYKTNIDSSPHKTCFVCCFLSFQQHKLSRMDSSVSLCLIYSYT